MLFELVEPKIAAVRIVQIDMLLHREQSPARAQLKIRGNVAGRPPLAVVAVERGGLECAAQHQRELPGKIVRIGDAGIHALAAGGQEPMRRVADQKDALVAIARRDFAGRTPGGAVDDFNHGRRPSAVWRRR